MTRSSVFILSAVVVVGCFILAPLVAEAFSQSPLARPQLRSCMSTSSSLLFAANGVMDESELKAELSKYLKKREEVGADSAAKEEVGKVIGGTRGNAVLEYISGAPNKQRVQEEIPDIFDYDELTKYGFSELVKPIMNNGGRRAMYQLMDLPEPAPRKKVKKKVSAPKLVIDRTGETDKARYSGLKISQ